MPKCGQRMLNTAGQWAKHPCRGSLPSRGGLHGTWPSSSWGWGFVEEERRSENEGALLRMVFRVSIEKPLFHREERTRGWVAGVRRERGRSGGS